MDTFRERLERAWKFTNSLVCVGMDVDVSQLPAHLRKRPQHDAIVEFVLAVAEKCAPHCAFFKFQIAFYEEARMLGAMIEAIQELRRTHHHHVVILDAKRFDVLNTAQAYARTCFDVYGADAVTLGSYPGSQSMAPFFERPDRGAIFVCRTSNPGAQEMQDAPVLTGVRDGEPLTEPYWLWSGRRIAAKWNANSNIGLVMGATYPGELRQMREAIGNRVYLLNPGLGKQQADHGEVQGDPVQLAVEAGQTEDGTGMIINSSRGIIFASDGEDFAEAAGLKAEELNNQINRYRILTPGVGSQG